MGAVAVATLLPCLTQAQKIHRIGIVAGTDKSWPGFAAFLDELQTLGYVDGQNISIISRFAVLIWDEPQAPTQLAEVREAARQLNMTVLVAQIMSPDDLEGAKNLFRKGNAEAIFVVDAVQGVGNRKRLAELAARLGLPAIYAQTVYPDAGGLISYGPNYDDLTRKAALYVDKILKGAKPGDLPIEQPTKFEMVINMKTAKALGLIIPQSILLRTTRVIE